MTPAETEVNVMGKHTEATVTEAIIKHFGGARSQGDGVRYVVASRVNNGAGFSYGRTLDVVVFDTWPSKGLSLDGIEIKVSKADLRRELQQPEKSGQFTDYLDTFSIAAPKNVLEGMRDLIPAKWGIYSVNDDGSIRTARRPLYLHDDGRDRAMCDRSFAAAFARSLVQRSLSREAEEAAYKRGVEEEAKRQQRHLDQENRKRERLETRINEFEAASGVKLSDYHANGHRIGEAVRFVLDGRLNERIRRAEDIRDMGRRLVAFADELEAHEYLLSLGTGEES